MKHVERVWLVWSVAECSLDFYILKTGSKNSLFLSAFFSDSWLSRLLLLRLLLLLLLALPLSLALEKIEPLDEY